MQTEIEFEKKQTNPTRPCFSVTQVTAKIKSLLEQGVGEVWVQGEISGFKPSTAGHLYFSLKDANAVLSCALFRGSNSRLKFTPKDGLEVIAHGRVAVYAPRGQYQLIVDYLEPLGHGALQLAFEQLRDRLQIEGLFDQARKRAMPEFPTKLAIITSPTGAALQDMLNVLGRRNSGIQILVVPSLVQGEEAAPQLIRALEIVNTFALSDVVVLARGGGSMEDLWCFNDERLVRAIAKSQIPVISAVGHEVDFTLCDFVADLRAPTPSAAAEMVSRSRLEVLQQVNAITKRMVVMMDSKVHQKKSLVLGFDKRLVSPSDQLARAKKLLSEYDIRLSHAVLSKIPDCRQSIDELHSRLIHLQERAFLRYRHRCESLIGRLEALSPLKVLGRGYTLTKDSVTGELLKSVIQATSGKNVTLIFKDGQAQSKIL